MNDSHRKAYLAEIKKSQLAENPLELIHRCPRCGAHMKENVLHNALSRHADVYVCDACGTAEAVRDWQKNPLALEDWFVFRNLEQYGEFPTTIDLLAIEPMIEDGALEVTFECWFDQEGKFGVDLSADDTWLNLYASYHPTTDNLVVSYVVSDNVNNFHYLYVPTENERHTVIGAMTRCCNVHGYNSIAAMVANAEDSQQAMIKNAVFTSVWDGDIAVTTSCKVNTETKEVFDIEILDVKGVTVLEKEFVTIDGKEYPVSRDEETEYWYD